MFESDTQPVLSLALCSHSLRLKWLIIRLANLTKKPKSRHVAFFELLILLYRTRIYSKTSLRIRRQLCLIIRLEARLQPNIQFTAACFGGVQAFGYNSTESEPIWMNSGSISVHCRGLALEDFGRDPRSSDSWRAKRIFCEVSNARFHRFPVGHQSSMTSIPVRAVGGVVFVIRVDEKSSLIQQVLVSGHMMHGDDGESHLTRPRVHYVTDVVAVSGCLLEGIPQLRHLGVGELELGDIALTQTQRTPIRYSRFTCAQKLKRWPA